MTQQEQALHNTRRILLLEQEKDKLRMEYLKRIAAINLEILQLQARNSNVTFAQNSITTEAV